MHYAIRFLFILPILCLIVVSIFIKQSKTIIDHSLNKQDIVWNSVVQKLDHTQDAFSLHKQTSLIPKAQASAEYTNAASYIAVDMDSGQVLFEKDSAKPLPIASLTKIMSSVVALDLENPTDTISISQYSSLMPPTKIGVVPGQTMTTEELLHAMLMTSANDAAQALMDGTNAKYGKDMFVQAMNEKARFLGLTHTHFANDEGFDDSQNYSSAEDLAILTQYALSHYPVIAQIVQKDYVQLPASASHKQFDLYNWNGLLGVYPGTTGMKIGNTRAAGYTTIVTADREGHKMLVVVLGAPGILQRDLWAASLLDDAFATYNVEASVVDATALRQKYATWQY